MDAPQIDTLPANAVPPPADSPQDDGHIPHRPVRFQTKPFGPRKLVEKGGDDRDTDAIAATERVVDDDEADEEDQLIDDNDNDEDDVPTSSAPASVRPTPTPVREPSTNRGRQRGPRRGRVRGAAAGVKRKRASDPDPAAALQIQFESFPAAQGTGQASDSSPASKKRKAVKEKEKEKDPVQVHQNVAKARAVPVNPHSYDTTPEPSEGHGTVPSSPAQDDLPDLDVVYADALRPAKVEPPVDPPIDETPPAPDAPVPVQVPVPPTESLKDTPCPRYPLPTRPFPVQAPPKIPTGYAPALPLDRTKVAPRHWRLAQREVRGIAGGRWFVRAWVGAQDSPLANAQAAPSQELLGAPPALPKLPAPPALKKNKAGTSASGASSRAGSVAPLVPPPPLTKKKSALSVAPVLVVDDEVESVMSVDAPA